MYHLYLVDRNKENKELRFSIDFPFCCHLSANLISSYLNVHFDTSFKHREYRNPFTMHGWSENSNEVIDFTGIQKVLSVEERDVFENKDLILSLDEFKILVEGIRDKHPIFQNKGDNEFEGFGVSVDNELYGVEIAKRYEKPYELDSFMKYVNEALPIVNKHVRYAVQ